MEFELSLLQTTGEASVNVTLLGSRSLGICARGYGSSPCPFPRPRVACLRAVEKANILNLDRLGMNVACERGKDAFKARLPFPRPATDRKSVKELIVEMTRAAAAAAAPSCSNGNS